MALANRIRNVVDMEVHAQPSDGLGEKEIIASGKALAETLTWLPTTTPDETFEERCDVLALAFKRLRPTVDDAFAKTDSSQGATYEALLWLRDNVQEFSSASRQLSSELGPLTKLPVVVSKEKLMIRASAIAQSFVAKFSPGFSKQHFTAFCLAFEERMPLQYHEVGVLVPTLRLVLLEQIASRTEQVVRDPENGSSQQITLWIQTYREVTRTSWKDELESLIPFDKILREDPAGTYANMDLESRNIYREK